MSETKMSHLTVVHYFLCKITGQESFTAEDFYKACAYAYVYQAYYLYMTGEAAFHDKGFVVLGNNPIFQGSAHLKDLNQSVEKIDQLDISDLEYIYDFMLDLTIEQIRELTYIDTLEESSVIPLEYIKKDGERLFSFLLKG